MTIDSRNDKVINAVNAVGSRLLADEIEYRVELDDQENRPRDYYDALNEAETMAEYNGDRALLTAARKALIRIGVYKHFTDAQLRNIETSSGKNYAFKLQGKKYLFDSHLK